MIVSHAVQVATPLSCPAHVIAGVVDYYARTYPDRKPPMFLASDVEPMLAGTDREYAAACALFDAGRVFYPPGEEL